jgi:hypothetical protein
VTLLDLVEVGQFRLLVMKLVRPEVVNFQELLLDWEC